jgi:hypothetical protein
MYSRLNQAGESVTADTDSKRNSLYANFMHTVAIQIATQCSGHEAGLFLRYARTGTPINKIFVFGCVVL